jgi:hypothetical protein
VREADSLIIHLAIEYIFPLVNEERKVKKDGFDVNIMSLVTHSGRVT